MKKFVLFFIFLFIQLSSYGQCPLEPIVIRSQEDINNYRLNYPNCTEPCPPGQIIFYTQTDLDNFKNNFPGCTELPYGIILRSEEIKNLGALNEITSIGTEGLIIGRVQGTGLIDLTGLNKLTVVNGSFRVDGNPSLKSLKGLESLKTIKGSFSFLGNPKLTSLKDLQSLQEINDFISIRVNHGLIDLEGLNHIKEINNQLTIESNKELQNLKGLESLVTINGALNIKKNEKLSSLKGLNKLTTISDTFIIEENDKLLTIEGVSNLQTVGSLFYIKKNRSLKNLRGLNSLATVGITFEISSNEVLRTLEGLDNIGNVNSLIVSSNRFLENIQSLSSLNTITNRLKISYNPKLKTCNVPYICNYIENSLGNYSISNNAQGCNTETEILEDCNDLCPKTDVVLTSQQDVDNFLTAYGGCTAVDVNVTIIGADISNLNGLNTIGTIVGNVIIKNTSLVNLSGLQLDKIVGKLHIENNLKLNSINSIKNIDSNGITNLTLTGNLLLNNCDILLLCKYLSLRPNSLIVSGNGNGCNTIEEIDLSCSIQCPNESLIFTTQAEINDFIDNSPNCTLIAHDVVISGNNINNLDGLKKLSSISGNLSIIQNPILTNLNGLEELLEVNGEILISNNSELLDIQAIKNISFGNTSKIEITNNPKLSTCGLPNICSYISKQSNTIVLSGNNTSCNTKEELQLICETNKCPSDPITFTKQEDIDNFLLQYPNCTELNIDVFIEGNDIINLEGFKNIKKFGEGTRFWIGGLSSSPNKYTSLKNMKGLENLEIIEGNFQIGGSPLLKSLDGLQSLTKVKGVFEIYNNPSLLDLTGLNNLKEVEQDFFISNNASLLSLNGLQSLQTVGKINRYGELQGILGISGNSSLKDLRGLDALQSVVSLELRETSLENTDGLSSLTEIKKDIHIYDNDVLKNIVGLVLINEVPNDLKIRSNLRLQNLFGLENITTVGRDIYIENNASLLNLEGLTKLNSTGRSFSVGWNSCLLDFSGIPNLRKVYGGLNIRGNNQVKNMTGFENLETITEGEFSIASNKNLESLEGFQNIKFDGPYASVIIYENPILKDISAFEDFSFLEISYLSITDNANLEMCSYVEFCSLINKKPNQAYISGNSTGCATKDEILENCEAVLNTISGTLKFNNSSLSCDIDGTVMDNIKVSATNGINTYSTFTNNKGEYILLMESGTYTTTIDLGGLSYDVSPSNYDITFTDYGESRIADFCVSTDDIINDVNITIIPKIEVRPGFDVTYQVVYENVGTTVLDGHISFQYDPSKQSFISSSPNEDIHQGNILSFNFTDLNPFEKRIVDVTMNTFAPPIVNDGEVVSFTTKIETNETDITPNDNVFVLDQTVVNSFDPNDKTVLEGETVNIEKVSEYLHYVVRFQNTGSASAINVFIKDILTDELDWTTLKPISSSHLYVANVTNGNLVEFVFDNINLPAKQDNEAGSNGFIAFKIKPKQGIQIGDIISGKANIFFDFNPPITTNTVSTKVILEYEDDDNDSVINDLDQCPNTPSGEAVNADGCSQSQLDDDNDGVTNDKDLCTNTPSGTHVDSVGCPIVFELPSDNFTIKSVGETCVDKKNGQIHITTKESHNYLASANGVEHNFNTNVIINNLTPDIYEICITIPEHPNYKQCYSLQVQPAKKVTGKSVTAQHNRKTTETIEITSGTAPYSVTINDVEVLKTDKTVFAVDVMAGDRIKVISKYTCEGTYEKQIGFDSKEIIAYPNPAKELVSIVIPNTIVKNVPIKIYDIKQQLILNTLYPVEDNKVEVSLRQLPKGLYFIKIEVETPTFLKIVKQ